MGEEIKRVCAISEIGIAAEQLCKGKIKNEIAVMIYNCNIKEIYEQLTKQISLEKRKDKIKKILKKLQ